MFFLFLMMKSKTDVCVGFILEVPAPLGILGLAIFTFAIGVQSGPNFFHVIRTAGGPLALMLLIFLVAAGAGVGLGRALGMSPALIAGTFAGATTNTPALAAAGNAAEIGRAHV